MNHIDYLEGKFKVFGLHKIVGGKCTCDIHDCQAAGKHPRISSWQFTPDWSDEQIDCMEMTGQFATGFGVICDGFLIIDIDPRNGGNEGYAKLEKDTGLKFKEMSNFVVSTGGGGWHIYFRNTSDLPLKKNLNDYPGIDFKSSGFVVGAESLHRSGKLYEAEKGHPCDVDNAPISLVKMLEKPVFTASSSAPSDTPVSTYLEFISPNCGYEDWIKVGMAIHHSTEGDGFSTWDNWSKAGDSYNGDEMDFKWHSFGKSANPVTGATLQAMAEDNGYVEPVTFDTTLTDDTEDDEPVNSEPVNTKLVNTKAAPGLLGECIDFINGNCRFPRENLAVAAAINAVGNIGGLRWRDDTYGVTANIFAFCVAGSATGKEAVQDAQKQLQSAAGLAPATFGKIKSEQELTRNLVDNQISSYIIDELGIFLQKLENASTRGSSSYLEGVIGDLMSIYSKADGRLLLSGDVYKQVTTDLKKDIAFCQKCIDENDNVEYMEKRMRSSLSQLEDLHSGGIHNPFLSMIGFTTPVTFNNLVTYQTATNGFIGRALIFEEKGNNPRSKPKFRRQPLSTSLQMKLLSLAGGGDADMDNQLRIEFKGEHEYVTTNDDAESLLDKIDAYLYSYAEHHCETTGLEPIVRRAFEQVLKISMVVAMGDGGKRTVEHVRWAYALVKKDIDNKINLAGGNIAKESKKKNEEILAKVQHCLDSSEGTTLGKIANRYRNLDKEQILACLEYLEGRGQARREAPASTGRGGRPQEKWYS